MRALVERVLLLGALLLVLLGCASKQKKTTFPDRKELAEIAAAPVKAEQKGPVARVEKWVAVRTDSEAASARQNPYRKLLKTSIGQDQGKGTQARVDGSLHCLAGHVGRFVLEQGAEPTERLRRFMAGRCGAWYPKPGAIVLQEKVPSNVPDGEVFERVKPHLKKAFGGVAHLPLATGIWVGRNDDRVVLVLGMGRRVADLRVIRRGPKLFRVRGRLLSPAAMVRALMTSGPHKTKPCRALPSGKLPAFAFECELAEGDHRAWLALMAQEPERLLGGTFADVLLFDRTPEAMEFTAPAAHSAPAQNQEQLRQAALVAINRARGEAGLPALRLAEKQSRWNDKLAAHFFASGTEGGAEKADRIALGLMAGWDVPGVIRNGSFIAVQLESSHDADEWLAYCMERPFAREQIMASDTKMIALGGTIDRPHPGLGVLASSYSFFDLSPQQEHELLNAALQEQRKQHGKGAASVTLDPVVQAAARRITVGKYGADQALQAAMDAVQKRTGKPVRGTVIIGNDLANQVFPQELIDHQYPNVHFGITHVKPPKAPWGAYVILVVLVEGEGGATVAGAGEPRVF